MKYDLKNTYNCLYKQHFQSLSTIRHFIFISRIIANGFEVICESLKSGDLRCVFISNKVDSAYIALKMNSSNNIHIMMSTNSMKPK